MKASRKPKAAGANQFGGTGMPSGQDDLADVLYAFGTSSDKLDVQDASDPSVASFLDRAEGRLSSFDSWDEVASLKERGVI